MVQAVVAFGSNLSPEENLPRAIARLARQVTLLALSPIYETPPVGAPGTPAFLNGALLIETSLSPQQLRDEILRPLESALARMRGPDPNAPRTLDLDLVLYADWIYESETLCLPAPDLLRYAHAAIPVADVAGLWRHPQTGERIAQIAGRFEEEQAHFTLRPDVEAGIRAAAF